MSLGFCFIFFSCNKDDDADNGNGNGTPPKGEISGDINGTAFTAHDIFSSFSQNAINNDDVLYVEAWSGYNGHNKPATDGSALLIRVEPYNGPGTYSANENSFWTFREQINTDGTWQNNTYIMHEYGDDLPSGSMEVVITSDDVVDGTRVVKGKLNGESGRTKSFDGMDQETLALQSFEIVDLTFTAPERKM